MVIRFWLICGIAVVIGLAVFYAEWLTATGVTLV